MLCTSKIPYFYGENVSKCVQWWPLALAALKLLLLIVRRKVKVKLYLCLTKYQAVNTYSLLK